MTSKLEPNENAAIQLNEDPLVSAANSAWNERHAGSTMAKTNRPETSGRQIHEVKTMRTDCQSLITLPVNPRILERWIKLLEAQEILIGHEASGLRLRAAIRAEHAALVRIGGKK